MNTYLSSTQSIRSARLKRNSNINSRAASKKGLGPISNIIFMGIILTLLGLMYLSQVTKANDYSFTISNLESQKEQLVEENQSLSIEAARLSAIDRLRTSEVAKTLDDPESIDFVR